jgi:hypothetical protein
MTTQPKCGNCAFAYTMPDDLTIRACKGGPPQAIMIPVRGSVSLQYVYPIVKPENDPCAFHKHKTFLDTLEGTT